MDRSFPLQALAFRGEEVKPPRALPCGVSTFPLSPAGVKCLPLQSTLCYYILTANKRIENQHKKVRIVCLCMEQQSPRHMGP